MAEPPDGVNPSTVPDLDTLDSLTEQDLYACVRWFQEKNDTRVHSQFWIDELSRRRTERALGTIADATRDNAQQVAEVAELYRQGAEQNAEMVSLNRRMVWLTVASVIVSAAAFTVAVVALVKSW